MSATIAAADLLKLIEDIVSDDFCEMLSLKIYGDRALGMPEPTKDEKTAEAKLSQIYRIAHSLNKSYSCHHVHKNWRKEVFHMLTVSTNSCSINPPMVASTPLKKEGRLLGVRDGRDR